MALRRVYADRKENHQVYKNVLIKLTRSALAPKNVTSYKSLCGTIEASWA